MIATRINNKKGFTLVETLVAVFILVLTISVMISLSVESFYNVRYAQNQITANLLSQEMIEYIRFTRDTAVQEDSDTGYDQWVASLSSGDGCLDIPSQWCDIDQFFPNNGTRTNTSIIISGNDPSDRPHQLYQYPSGEYISSTEYLSDTVSTGPPSPSPFSRGVRFTTYGDDQIEATVRIEWKNGSFERSHTESIILTKW